MYEYRTRKQISNKNVRMCINHISPRRIICSKVEGHSAVREIISLLLWNTEFHFCVLNTSTLDFILSHVNLVNVPLF
jgi:hypothetical protein